MGTLARGVIKGYRYAQREARRERRELERELEREDRRESRELEREARRESRELERQQKYSQKLQELEEAAIEVSEFENHINGLISSYKQCGKVWNWSKILSSKPPAKPSKLYAHENAAKDKLNEYKPSFFDKLLRRSETKRRKLASDVEKAKLEDEKEYKKALKNYEQRYGYWNKLQKLANKIIAGDPKGLIEACKGINTFKQIIRLIPLIEFKTDDSIYIEAILRLRGDEIIPDMEKKLLKSGRLSVKKMPKTKFYKLYHDYVWGCVLRVVRELFALLPIEMTIITAFGKVFNSQTGHREEHPLLSIVITRKIMENLDFETLSISDVMQKTVSHIKFLKTKGFRPIKKIELSDVKNWI